MIELRTLAYFVTACRCETLARAAKAHGIALSTLSTSLRALEKEVGVSLLRRINAGLYPTAQPADCCASPSNCWHANPLPAAGSRHRAEVRPDC